MHVEHPWKQHKVGKNVLRARSKAELPQSSPASVEDGKLATLYKIIK